MGNSFVMEQHANLFFLSCLEINLNPLKIEKKQVKLIGKTILQSDIVKIEIAGCIEANKMHKK